MNVQETLTILKKALTICDESRGWLSEEAIEILKQANIPLSYGDTILSDNHLDMEALEFAIKLLETIKLKPSEEEIQKLIEDLLKGAPLKPFDNGYVRALEWVIGKRECLYEK